ncbi:MAG: OmpH family outer membrane protein [Planctomycetaceae bacterium]
MRLQLFVLGTISISVCLFAASTFAQKQSVDDLAKEYNKQVEPLQEEIDSLRKMLDNAELTLDEKKGLIDQQTELQKKADELWNNSQSAIDGAFRQKRDDIVNFNDETKSLQFESAVVGSKMDVLNNIVKYPNKSDFDKNLPEMSKAWQQQYGERLKPFGEEFAKQKEEIFKRVQETYGIDMRKDGYDRIGTSNPYDNKAYYKYYNKDGKPTWVQWQNDADGWKKYQEDVEAIRRRKLDDRKNLKKDSKLLKELNNLFFDARDNTNVRIASLGDDIRGFKVPGEFNILGVWNYVDTLRGDQATFEFFEGGALTITLASGSVQDQAKWWETGENSFRVSWNGESNFEDFTINGDTVASDRAELTRP